MLKNTLIIALIILAIYLYYQNRQKPHFLTGNSTDTQDTIRDLQTQLQQAQQLQTYNTQKLTNYETLTTENQSLKKQIKTLQGEGD